MELNRRQIEEILPHRDPFLLIDEVIELIPGEKAVAIKHVRADEYYFEGHFPENPVMPGVLQIEALAQAGAVAVLSLPENRGKIAYFAAIDKAKFRGMVVPGDELRLEVVLENLRSRGGKGKAVAYKEGKLVCECEITFMFSATTQE
ncbi:MAG: 3-hydroxyacyl-ACP dehydratase FabZ [Clostridiales Family XIII bacterium]|jgi:3-hydroxyacyl-[acyl-carrier-protein] dehydratase|nr:3-hydroxyacyl-ACP dehydratase FabZ [Clostridiales Family XIII bacterium]